VTFVSSVCSLPASWWPAYRPKDERFAVLFPSRWSFISPCLVLRASSIVACHRCEKRWVLYSGTKVRPVAFCWDVQRFSVRLFRGWSTGGLKQCCCFILWRTGFKHCSWSSVFLLETKEFQAEHVSFDVDEDSRSICKGLCCFFFFCQVLLCKGLVVMFLCF
jgi:hypothetical protein